MSAHGIPRYPSVAMPMSRNKRPENRSCGLNRAKRSGDMKMAPASGNAAAAPILRADRSCRPRPSQPGTFGRVGLQAGYRVACLTLRKG